MKQFIDDEQGYLRWIAGNPGGFVASSYRRPTPDYIMLCRDLAPENDSVWLFGMTREWPGDTGKSSSRAKAWRFSRRIGLVGLQNGHSGTWSSYRRH